MKTVKRIVRAIMTLFAVGLLAVSISLDWCRNDDLLKRSNLNYESCVCINLVFPVLMFLMAIAFACFAVQLDNQATKYQQINGVAYDSSLV